MAYSGFRKKTTTPQDISEFHERISCQPTEDAITWSRYSDLGRLPPLNRRISWDHPSRWITRNTRSPRWEWILPEEVDPWDILHGSEDRLKPVLRTAPTEYELLEESWYHPWNMEYWDHFDWGEFPEWVSDVEKRVVFQGDYPFPETVVGRIGFLHEPGLKLRTVVNPLLSFSGEPLPVRETSF
jgi:hypothetical protein